MLYFIEFIMVVTLLSVGIVLPEISTNPILRNWKTRILLILLILGGILGSTNIKIDSVIKYWGQLINSSLDSAVDLDTSNGIIMEDRASKNSCASLKNFTEEQYVEQDKAECFEKNAPFLETTEVISPLNLPPTISTSPATNCGDTNILSQGIQYIVISDAKPTVALRNSDLNNAIHIFDSVVQEAKNAGTCCSKALMNRGIAHDLLGESNFAFDDLKAAEQCEPLNTEVHYNFARLYAKHSTKTNQTLDLSLQELEKAVELGLKNCNQILNDSDLMRLRRDKYFKIKLHDMLQQHGQFCIVDFR